MVLNLAEIFETQKKLDFEPERLAIWTELIKTVNQLDDIDSLMSKISEEKRAMIIVGNLNNLEKFTYAMCSRQLLPQIKVVFRPNSMIPLTYFFSFWLRLAHQIYGL